MVRPPTHEDSLSLREAHIVARTAHLSSEEPTLGALEPRGRTIRPRPGNTCSGANGTHVRPCEHIDTSRSGLETSCNHVRGEATLCRCSHFRRFARRLRPSVLVGVCGWFGRRPRQIAVISSGIMNILLGASCSHGNFEFERCGVSTSFLQIQSPPSCAIPVNAPCLCVRLCFRASSHV